MPFNQNFHTRYCKKKSRLNILISCGNIKGDTGLMGHTVYMGNTVQYLVIYEDFINW
jgi:hypothetical protein